MDFIKGICHPGTEYNLMVEAGIKWARFDTPYPFDQNGNISPAYESYKARCVALANHGIKSFGISPYPRTFLAYGIDPRCEEGLKKCEEICEYISRDLAGLVDGWQITNEMYVIEFRAPLTHSETLPFIIACGKGLRKGNPGALIGHNSACAEWKPYNNSMKAEIGLDYVGLDCYAGTWWGGGPKSFKEEIQKAHELGELPVILQEFGFASLGDIYEPGEDIEYLNKLGFADWDDAIARMDEFCELIPKPIAENVRRAAPEDKANLLRGSTTHLLKKWGAKGDIEHTLEGQAQFFDELLATFENEPNLIGAIVYCWKDPERCFNCGQADCPCETAWGLVDKNGIPKPAYYAVKKHFAK